MRSATIVNNPLLTDVAGLDNCESINHLGIINNPILQDLTIFGETDLALGGLRLENNDMLQSIPSFNNIISSGSIHIFLTLMDRTDGKNPSWDLQT